MKHDWVKVHWDMPSRCADCGESEFDVDAGSDCEGPDRHRRLSIERRAAPAPGERFQSELLKMREWGDRGQRELDAIDLAYLQLEKPMVIVRAEPTTTSEQRRRLLASIRELTGFGVLMVPTGFEIEVTGPSYTSAPPFELARWADDGGRV